MSSQPRLRQSAEIRMTVTCCLRRRLFGAVGGACVLLSPGCGLIVQLETTSSSRCRRHGCAQYTMAADKCAGHCPVQQRQHAARCRALRCLRHDVAAHGQRAMSCRSNVASLSMGIQHARVPNDVSGGSATRAGRFDEAGFQLSLKTGTSPLPSAPVESAGGKHHGGSLQANITTNATLNGDVSVGRLHINGSKNVTRRRRPAAGSASVTLPTVDDSKRAQAGKKRRLKRVARSSTGEVVERPRGRQPLVVTDNMDLSQITQLVQEVLERVSDTERELRRLRQEGNRGKSRSTVRARKFVIDTRAKMLGAAFAGSIGGLIVGWSILPNLRLLGAVSGAISCAAFTRTGGTVGHLCSTAGIQVALVYKDIRDWWDQTVFLYKTGKLSYTYWRTFEKYDKAWGLTDKYNTAVLRVSEEARELDRQYKIRAKATSAGRRLTFLAKEVGSSATKEASQLAAWGGDQLKQWGLLGDDNNAKSKRARLRRLVLQKWSSLAAVLEREGKRPLGLVDLSGLLGENGGSLYSAPAAGKKRKPGYHGDPIIPARIRHIFMSSKQIRDERLRKYRVGFMGRRTFRAFDKAD